MLPLQDESLILAPSRIDIEIVPHRHVVIITKDIPARHLFNQTCQSICETWVKLNGKMGMDESHMIGQTVYGCISDLWDDQQQSKQPPL